MNDHAVQPGLFDATDGRMQAFMQRFAKVDFGRPDSWCNCQRCRYARLTVRVADGSISREEFYPYYRQFVADGYVGPGEKGGGDPWTQLGTLGYEFSQETQ